MKTTRRTDELGATRPKPRQADASLTADTTPKSPKGDFSPPVPQGSGGDGRPRRNFSGNLVDVLHACTLLNALAWMIPRQGAALKLRRL